MYVCMYIRMYVCMYCVLIGTLKPDDKSHWILAEKGVVEQVRSNPILAR